MVTCVCVVHLYRGLCWPCPDAAMHKDRLSHPAAQCLLYSTGFELQIQFPPFCSLHWFPGSSPTICFARLRNLWLIRSEGEALGCFCTVFPTEELWNINLVWKSLVLLDLLLEARRFHDVIRMSRIVFFPIYDPNLKFLGFCMSAKMGLWQYLLIPSTRSLCRGWPVCTFI